MESSLDLKILRILLERTDETHRLTQKAIQDLVNREGVSVGSRAVRNALRRLMADVEDIECEEIKRSRSDIGDADQDNSTHSGFYIKHLFPDELLSFLIDMVAFSDHLPVSYRQEITAQLMKLGSCYFRPRRLLLDRPPHAENRHFFLNLQILQEAIQKGRKVSLQYMQYGPDMQLQVRTDAAGAPRVDIVSPYQLAMRGTRYYLICNHARYNNLAHYRLDRMQNVQLLSERARPLSDLDGAGGSRLDLDEYWQQHNEFSGDVIRAQLRLGERRISDAVDTFGRFVSVQRTEKGMEATVRAGRMLIEQFALRYAPDVIVLSPPDLRSEIGQRLRACAALYEDAQQAESTEGPPV